MNASITRVYRVMVGAVLVLIVMLGYWQVVAAGGLRDEPDNRQRIHSERLVDRGRIISADGQVLAVSTPARVGGDRVYRRLYPHGDLAAHALGYISDDRGKTGLESSYDRYLRGSFGTEPLLQRLGRREKTGADVRLFLDTRVQRVAQQELSGLRGAVVAIDPQTGGVIAMASSPTYPVQQVLRDYSKVSSGRDGPLLNRATAGRYPPGSTFKVVTASAALQSGRFSAASTFDDTGTLATPGGPIRNFDGAVYGRHTLETALSKSINTTFARVAQEVGADQLGRAMSAYGFGKPPPIDLPRDQLATSGRRDGADRLEPNIAPDADIARIGIGQEKLAVTPLQMAMVAAGIANGGAVPAPRLMQGITTRSGEVVKRESPAVIGRPLSAANAATLTSMMEGVVNEGTGTAAALSGLQVAGKTGTAETDDPNRNQAWFIGFAPAGAPKVAVAVVVEDTPSTGGEAAAPIAGAVMDAAITAAGP